MTDRRNNDSGVVAGVKKKAGKDHRPVRQKKSNTRLVIMSGCFSGLEISLEKKRISLGRNVECDICLDHSFVSEEHATITKSGGQFILEDLNSRHGTSINGKEIHKVRLKKGNIIGIGDFKIRFDC